MTLNRYDFNEAQWSALMAPIDTDVLVSAGAGSGKTFVLSQKVYKHIVEGDVKPSEVLVLTFTNNAAHEMKERIIACFGGLRLKGLPGFLDATFVLEGNEASLRTVSQGKRTKTRKLRLLEKQDPLDPYVGVWIGEGLSLQIDHNGTGTYDDGSRHPFSYEAKDDSHFQNEILSSHIQTFDSFNQYLLGLYGDRLGYPRSITVAPECLMSAKREKLLEGILNEDYQDASKKECLEEAISLFSYNSDDGLREAVKELSESLCELNPEERANFYASFEERCFSRDSFAEYLKSLRQKVIDFIGQRVFNAYCILHPEKSFTTFDPANPLKASDFGDNPILFDMVGSLDECEQIGDPLSFFAALDSLTEHYPAFYLYKDSGWFSRLTKKYPLSKEETDVTKEAAKEIRKIAWSGIKDCFALDAICYSRRYQTFEKAYAQHLRLKEPVGYILSLAKRLDERLEADKKASGALTFTDIKHAALRLLVDPHFADAAEEIRSRFKFIVIDEYQDTEPAQEAFIDAMLKTKSDGSRSHLFAVGDAKQSIYAFRGSDVSLFNERKAALADGHDGHQVIPMNVNYRSGEKLLSAINRIFGTFMSVSQGGIDYTLESERLKYPSFGGSFDLPYDDFGISRITSTTGVNDDMGLLPETPLVTKNYRIEWEASAIADDIKRKIDSGYKVYDPKAGIRPCRYDDFAILIRNGKKSFRIYSSVFERKGIPLNFKISAELDQSEPVILISSLLGLIGEALGLEKADVPHLFASIARSYAYRYDDKRLEEILFKRDESGRPSLDAIRQEPLMKDIDDFAIRHKDATLTEIFLDLVVEFPVIEALPRLGDVAKYVQDIDELQTLLKASEEAGEGLDEFLIFLKDINRYGIKLTSEESISMSGAVDLMTIHASKGLGRLIVYLPMFGNQKGRDEGERVFDSDLGFVKPYHRLPSEADPEPNAFSVPYALNVKDETKAATLKNEAVRLYYVALTRAQNQVIFVGDPLCKGILRKEEQDKETLQWLYEGFEAYSLTEEALSAFKKRFGACPGFDMNAETEYRKNLEKVCSFATLADDKQNQEALDRANEARTAVNDFLASVLSSYLDEFEDALADPDIFARIYAFGQFQYDVEDQDGLFLRYRKKSTKESIFDEDGDDEEEEWDEDDEAPSDPGRLPGTLKKAMDWYANHADADVIAQAIAGIKVDEGPNTNPLIILRGIFYVYEGIKKSVTLNFNSSIYKERESVFDLSTYDKGEKKDIIAPSYPVDDSEIPFPMRVKARASKLPSFDDEDNPIKEALTFGVRLHSYFENVDWDEPDASFIENPGDRKRIQRVLEMPLLQSLRGGEFFPEYQYYDPELATTGSIDLLVRQNGHLTIIDWKTKSIDDEAYDGQLRVYRHNVSRLFGVEEESIDLYLVSILEASARKVE